MHKSLDIVHIDLSAELPRLESRSEYDGVWATFWWGSLPLGHRVYDAAELPVEPARLVVDACDAVYPAVSARSSRLPERPTHPDEAASWLAREIPPLLPQNRTHPLSVSVVVATCRRPEALEQCLKSLESSSIRPSEVIVVDNAPNGGDAALVAERFGAWYVAEPRPGSSAARNTGARHSRSDVVVFIDDDETAHPGWLAGLTAAFSDSAVNLATGLVLPAELRTKSQVIFEQRYGFSRGFLPRRFDADFYARTSRRGVPTWALGGSGNMAVRRAEFIAFGGFDERLGAGRSGGGEDLELFHRALAAGWTCAYEPAAVTFHRHRADRAELRSQLRDYMQGHVAAFFFQYAKHRNAGDLRHLLLRLPIDFAGSVRRMLAGDPRYSLDLLWNEMTGYAAGVRYFLAETRRSRRDRARFVWLDPLEVHQRAHASMTTQPFRVPRRA